MKRYIIAILATLSALAATAQRFAVLSDLHVTPGNACDSALRVVVDEINGGGFDLVVVNGDLTNEGSDAEIAHVKGILDGIKLPMVVLPGNHEDTWSQSATKTFVDIFGADRFVTEVDSLLIVGINCGPYMKMGDGHVKQEDLHWLRSTLDSRLRPGMKVVSFNHYPIQKDDLDNYLDYQELLSDYPVIIHINGHYHTWRPYHAGTIACGMTRALDMRGGDYGYAIVEIDPQWVHFYNKRPGKAAEPKYAFAVRTEHKKNTKDTATQELPMPEGFDVHCVWTDSASIFTRLAFDDDNVYFGTSTGLLKAVDKATGRERWRNDVGASVFSKPMVLGNGKVAFPHASGISIVDDKTGKVVKEYASKEGPYVADGIMAADGKSWIQGGYKRIEKRDARNGKLLWCYDSLFNYCQAMPAIAGDDVIFGAWDTNLRCLDARTGRLRWVWNNGKNVNMLGPGNVVPVVNDSMVVIVAPDRFMTALDRQTGEQLWRDKSHRYRESLGRSADGSVAYAKTMDGELVAVDATSHVFRELWTVDMGLGYEHAPCIVLEQDGVVYAGSRRGIITAVDPAKQEILWQLTLGSSEVNGFDVDPTDGSVWLSLIEGSVYRIAKK